MSGYKLSRKRANSEIAKSDQTKKDKKPSKKGD